MAEERGGNLIGLDVGDVRVGVALSDALLVSIAPYGSFKRARGEAERKIVELIKERNPRTLVVGLPLSAQGARTAQCERVEAFVRRITRRVAIPVVYCDEHLSSEDAKERVGPMRAEEGAIDAVAAAVILEDFIRSKPAP